jgi:hypothetical protein
MIGLSLYFVVFLLEIAERKLAGFFAGGDGDLQSRGNLCCVRSWSHAA